MKIKNLKIKKAAIILGGSLVLASIFNYEHPYSPQYEIVEGEDYFATYSKGKIYIGSMKFLNSIKDKVNENDILIYDNRFDDSNPDVKILSSYRITDKDVRNEILEVLMEYERLNPSPWDRSIETMRLEWFVHNLSYRINYKLDHSTDVDLDNNEEEMYDNVKILHKLLKL